MKYVLVTGGVVSGLGKGVTASSIGVVLKACGLRVTSIKIGLLFFFSSFYLIIFLSSFLWVQVSGLVSNLYAFRLIFDISEIWIKRLIYYKFSFLCLTSIICFSSVFIIAITCSLVPKLFVFRGLFSIFILTAVLVMLILCLLIVFFFLVSCRSLSEHGCRYHVSFWTWRGFCSWWRRRGFTTRLLLFFSLAFSFLC